QFAVKGANEAESSRAIECRRNILQFAWLDREAAPEELFMAKALLEGIHCNREEIDGLIAEYLQNWTVDRLLAVDRAILRLGVYTLKYLPDTPAGVVINECVELCHKFSDGQSYRLINGVLDTLAETLRVETLQE
ncbi:MAG: transcription antitermination factor NusB, partial [Spirochaetota bacterium]